MAYEQMSGGEHGYEDGFRIGHNPYVEAIVGQLAEDVARSYALLAELQQNHFTAMEASGTLGRLAEVIVAQGGIAPLSDASIVAYRDTRSLSDGTKRTVNGLAVSEPGEDGRLVRRKIVVEDMAFGMSALTEGFSAGDAELIRSHLDYTALLRDAGELTNLTSDLSAVNFDAVSQLRSGFTHSPVEQ